MLHQLLAAVVTSNVYDEAKDVANDNKTRTWLCTVADWLLSLKSRLCRILWFAFVSKHLLSGVADWLLLPHASKVLFLALSVTGFVCFFVCHSNILGTAERICAKFAEKTCLVPRLDEFKCQGQRSRSPGTKNDKLPSHPHWQCLLVRCAPYAVRCRRQHTIPLHHTWGWRGDGNMLTTACKRCMFGRTALAVVESVFVVCWPSYSVVT